MYYTVKSKLLLRTWNSKYDDDDNDDNDYDDDEEVEMEVAKKNETNNIEMMKYPACKLTLR